MSKYCVNCGTKLKDEYNACFNCGTMVDNKEKLKVKTEVINIENKVDETNYFALIGFIISLISSVLCCGVLNIVSLGLSIAGLVNAGVYKKGKGYAVAGIIISIIPIILYIIFIILGMLGVFDSTVPFKGYKF